MGLCIAHRIRIVWLTIFVLLAGALAPAAARAFGGFGSDASFPFAQALQESICRTEAPDTGKGEPAGSPVPARHHDPESGICLLWLLQGTDAGPSGGQILLSCHARATPPHPPSA